MEDKIREKQMKQLSDEARGHGRLCQKTWPEEGTYSASQCTAFRRCMLELQLVGLTPAPLPFSARNLRRDMRTPLLGHGEDCRV